MNRRIVPPGRLISRRTAIKLMGAGALALYLRPGLEVRAATSAKPAPGGTLADWSPIDRSLGDLAPPRFFGDEPEQAHKLLWDKPGYLASLGGQAPKPGERVKLAIIGGGMGGLFSAWLLRQHQPLLLEQAPRFGGNAKGQSWRGADYSIGAAYFIEPEADSDIARLAAEIGIDKLWKVSGEEPETFELNGKLHEDFWTGNTAPEARPQFEKLSAYFNAVYEGETEPYPDIPIVDPEQEAYIKGLDKVSFAAHLQKVAGGRLHAQAETAIEHYCWSSFGGSMGEISAAAGLNFYTAELGNLIVLPGGNAAIAEQVLNKLSGALPPGHLRPGSLVYDVTVVEDGVLVSYADRDGKAHTLHAQSVVMACPKFVVAKILNGVERERAAAIARLSYRSYLVANILLKGGIGKSFYDLYLLGDGKTNLGKVQQSQLEQKATDVVLGTYARPTPDVTVLTLYRGLPYDGARPELYAPGVFARYKQVFEQQVVDSILPLLGLQRANVVDLRIARWGHPLPLAATGLIADGTVDQLRKPFRERVFFVEQDNWALPAFETSVTEAITWSQPINKLLDGKSV